MKIRPLITFLFMAIIFLACSINSNAETYPTRWSLAPAQDSEGVWWKALQVQTIPGVVYRLQKSTTLMTGSWSVVASRYGMGEEWICPVLPGSAPPVGTLPQEVLALSEEPAEPVRAANLTLSKNAAGDIVVSWPSLDEGGGLKQSVLTGTSPDPVWDEFQAAYFGPHGNHFFAISPQLFNPVEAIPSAAFGPLDTAMLANFQSSLPAITANITNSVIAAAAYEPAADNTQNEKAFYRIVADWGVDTNGGGRFDWQQLILDGTNPFAPGEGLDGKDLHGMPEEGSGMNNLGLPGNTYAAKVGWTSTTRQLYYTFDEADPDEDEEDEEPQDWKRSRLVTSATWDPEAGIDETGDQRKPFSSLRGILGDLKFPPLFKSDAMFTVGIYSYSERQPHFEYVVLQEMKLKLDAERQAATDMERILTVLKTDSFGHWLGIKPHTLVMPAKKWTSEPITLGDDFEPNDGSAVFYSLHPFDFYNWIGTPAKMGDDTYGMMNISLAQGQEQGVDYDLNGFPPRFYDWIEIATPQHHVVLSGKEFEDEDGYFRVIGQLPTTNDLGTEVHIRLKSNPSVILAKMKAHVFEPRTVPVSIFRIYDSDIPSTEVFSAFTDEEIIASLNDTFKTQGAITFILDPDSGGVDLKPEAPEAPRMFDSNGVFHGETSIFPTIDITKLEHGKDPETHLTIHIVENFSHRKRLGTTIGGSKASFISASAPLLTYPHEVGHSLGLATQNAGPEGGHDTGPWPNHWSRTEQTGLMYMAIHTGMTAWLRATDWIKANATAEHLK